MPRSNIQLSAKHPLEIPRIIHWNTDNVIVCVPDMWMNFETVAFVRSQCGSVSRGWEIVNDGHRMFIACEKHNRYVHCKLANKPERLNRSWLDKIFGVNNGLSSD